MTAALRRPGPRSTLSQRRAGNPMCPRPGPAPPGREAEAGARMLHSFSAKMRRDGVAEVSGSVHGQS